jgi:hypothetical protein
MYFIGHQVPTAIQSQMGHEYHQPMTTIGAKGYM